MIKLKNKINKSETIESFAKSAIERFRFSSDQKEYIGYYMLGICDAINELQDKKS